MSNPRRHSALPFRREVIERLDIAEPRALKRELAQPHARSEMPAEPLVEAMQQLPCLTDLDSRNFIVRLLVDELGELPIEESTHATQHVAGIVDACRRQPNGLATVLDVLGRFDCDTIYFPDVQRIVAEMTVLAGQRQHFVGEPVSAPGRTCRRLVTLAVCVLPANYRSRYTEEFRADLWELSRGRRLGYAVRLVVHSWSLRRNLLNSAAVARVP